MFVLLFFDSRTTAILQNKNRPFDGGETGGHFLDSIAWWFLDFIDFV